MTNAGKSGAVFGVYLLGLGAALFFGAGPTQGVMRGVILLLAALCIQLRLVCNLLDGMVAVEHGKGSPSGPIWNELPDRFADVLFQREARRREHPVERGTDLYQSVTISFETAMRGAALAVTVTRHEHCRSCKGLGRLNVAETRCPQCHGSGVVKSARGHMVFSKPCAACSGSGHLRHIQCPTCAGEGVVHLVELALDPLHGLERLHDPGVERLPGRRLGPLRQVADRRAADERDRAAVRLLAHPREDPEERRLSRSVRADERDLLAGLDGPRRAAKDLDGA